MNRRKWHILISVVVMLAGIILLLISQRMADPSANLFWAAIRDLGLALIVGAVPYALFKWIVGEVLVNAVRHMGSKRDAGPTFDRAVKRAKDRLDVIGLSLNDFFSGSTTPALLVEKLRAGCKIRLFVLDPDSKILDLRAADEGITGSQIRQSILRKSEEKWQDLSRRLAAAAPEHELIPGRLELLFYQSLPYFTVIRADKTTIFGLYNRNAACSTSAAFDVSHNPDLCVKFEEDLNYLAGSNLITRKAIHFRGGPGAIFESIY